MLTVTISLENEQATIDFGAGLLSAIQCIEHIDRASSTVLREQAMCIYLLGDLGAGKTTLSRGILRAAGCEGAVKSPTYTLVEPYVLPDGLIYHFDLYRLSDPYELEFLGVEQYFDDGMLCLIEWPGKGADLIPSADLTVTLFEAELQADFLKDSKPQNEQRVLTVEAKSKLGIDVLSQFIDDGAALWKMTIRESK